MVIGVQITAIASDNGWWIINIKDDAAIIQTGELWLTIIHGGSMWFLLSKAIGGFSEKILAPVGCRAEPGSLATLARARGSSFVPAAAPSGPVHRTSSFWFGSQVTGGLDLDQNFRDFPGCVVKGSRLASGVWGWRCAFGFATAVCMGTGCTSDVRSSFLRRLRPCLWELCRVCAALLCRPTGGPAVG